jgi:hypothetical protein
MKIFGLICSVLALLSGNLYAQTPATLYPTQDCYVNYTSSGGSIPINNTSLRIGVATANTNYTRTFIQFDDITDPGMIPSNVVIVSATLNLRVSFENPVPASGDYTLQTVTSAWSESSTTAINPTFSGTSPVTSNFSSGTGLRSFDVTQLVRTIYNSGLSSNNGWMIRRTSEAVTSAASLYRSNDNAADRPTLDVLYYYPITVTGAAIDFASTATSADGSVTPTVSGGPGGTWSYAWYNNSNAAIPGATSLALTGVNPGCYYLKITPGSYDPFYMAFIVGQDCEAVGISFSNQAAMPNYMDDAYISGYLSSLSVNYGTSGSNIADRAYTSPLWYGRSSYMRFRLWMPPEQYVVKANLTMYGNGHGTALANNARFARVTSDWNESTIRSLYSPGSSNDVLVAVPATAAGVPNQNLSIEIRDFWNYWKAANTANYGMNFALATSSNTQYGQSYHSSDAATVTNRPKIDFVVDDASCDKTGHSPMLPELDGGYALTSMGRLKFSFDEEYAIDAGSKVPLKLYNSNHQLIAAVDIHGQQVETYAVLPALSYTFGDNRHSLNLQSLGLLSGSFYELELTRASGEKSYLKFQYIN